MAISVTRSNTKLLKAADGGWVTIVHDTGEVDTEGQPVTIRATVTTASIEKQAGVLLPKLRIKAIAEGALNQAVGTATQEIDVL